MEQNVNLASFSDLVAAIRREYEEHVLKEKPGKRQLRELIKKETALPPPGKAAAALKIRRGRPGV